MSDFLKAFRTDKTAEENGVWITIGNGVKVKVRRFNSPRVQKYLETLRKPYRNYRDNNIPSDIMEDIMRKVAAKEIVVDWEGIDSPETEAPIKYSADVAEKLFKDLPDFYRVIFDLALSKDTFLADSIDAVKND